MAMDFTIQTPNLVEQGLRGYQLGRGLQMQYQQNQALQAQQQRKQAYQNAMAQLAQKQNTTADDYLRLQTEFPEQMKAIQEVNAQKNEVQLQNDILDMQKIVSAIDAKKPNIAKDMLDQRIEALKNSGRENEAQAFEMMKEQVDVSPEAVMIGINRTLAASMGPEEFRRFLDQRLGRGESGKVAKSEIYPDGTTLSIMSSGSPVITSPDGTILKGQDAANAIIKAQEYGSDLAKRINWNRETGKLEAQDELKAQVEGKTVQAKEQAKLEEQRSQDFINKGIVAADSIPTLKRSIELLKSVKTGGFQSALIRAKGAFGIQGADEGELTYNLSKNVLSQLKSTFGAQFTEREGAWLNRIESGIGRNNATNIAIINQALKTAERKVKKAISIAKKNGDWDTVAELEDLMSFSLSPSNKTKITEKTESLVPGQSGTEPTTKYINEQQKRIEEIKRKLSGQ